MIDFLFALDWALFFSALASSTLFPGGSEALLAYRLQDVGVNAYMLVAMATLGNVLGSVITYAMGRGGQRLSQGWLWLHPSENKMTKAERLFQRYGAYSLFFAWLPIVGDPLCLVAGVLRYHFVLFVALVTVGKLARYSLLAWAFL
ncbi:MAG: YqaA family protein [Ghiorsea sp.]